MTVQEIYQWIKERDRVLEKRDVKDLLSFIEKWEKKGVYEKKFVKEFKNATLQVQTATLCKMIRNVPTLSKETLHWALLWLIANNSTKSIL